MELAQALFVYSDGADASKEARREAARCLLDAVTKQARRKSAPQLSEADREDLVQDAMIALLSASFRGASEGEAWRYVETTVRRLMIRCFKKEQRSQGRDGGASAAGEVGAVVQGSLQHYVRPRVAPLPPSPEQIEDDPVRSRPDVQQRTQEVAAGLREAEAELLGVLLPTLELTMRPSARASFRETLKELWQLREEEVTRGELESVEQAKAPGRTAKQASDALDQRVRRARLRVLELLHALEHEAGRLTHPEREQRLSSAVQELAQRLLAEREGLASRLVMLRVVSEWLCFEPQHRRVPFLE